MFLDTHSEILYLSKSALPSWLPQPQRRRSSARPTACAPKAAWTARAIRTASSNSSPFASRTFISRAVGFFTDQLRKEVHEIDLYAREGSSGSPQTHRGFAVCKARVRLSRMCHFEGCRIGRGDQPKPFCASRTFISRAVGFFCAAPRAAFWTASFRTAYSHCVVKTFCVPYAYVHFTRVVVGFFETNFV